jgi:integrase
VTKIKLTKTTVEKLPYAEKGKQVDYYDSDLDGFGIRVSHTGKKYFVRRLIGAKRVRVMIGSHPIKTAEEARSEARIKLGAMESGVDPNEHKREQVRLQEDKAKEITIAKLCEEYIEKHAKRFKKSWEEDDRILTREILPPWGKRKAAAIVKRDVLLMLETIIDRGSPGMANNTFQVIRKMFNFAVERDILKFSPCLGVKLPTPKQSRDRALSEPEIRLFWNNLSNCAISNEIKLALKLVLVTAQRPGEVIGLHTSEIDGGWWNIPTERAKNGKAHRVPLTPLAMEIIEQAIAVVKATRELPADHEYSGFIFPSPHRKKEQSIDRHAMAIATMRNLTWTLTDKKGKPLYGKDGKPATENRFEIDHFTPHDLRRTAATRMAESGEMDEVIDAILNHAKQGVIKVYNQFKYDAQKQLALESWARKLVSITTGIESNVISLRRKAS